MIRARTKSVDDTKALAAALTGLLRAGDVLLLAGDLGAGKTAFVQGLAAELGVDEPVTSPTFVIARTYDGGRLRVHHLDVYRLDTFQEAIDVGLPELVDDEAVTVVEWGDVIIPTIPSEFLELRLHLGEGDDEREITVRAAGPSWSNRLAAVTQVLDPWIDRG